MQSSVEMNALAGALDSACEQPWLSAIGGSFIILVSRAKGRHEKGSRMAKSSGRHQLHGSDVS